MRMNCIDCGKSIATADGGRSVRDRCIPCGAVTGSPFLSEHLWNDFWKDASAGMAKLSAMKVDLLLGLHARAQGDIVTRLAAVAIIDRCSLQISDEYKIWKETI